MSRRLIKALEDLSIFYDNTVRNASACIVQFVYGGDAMDPAQMEEKTGLPLNFERLFMKAKVLASIFFTSSCEEVIWLDQSSILLKLVFIIFYVIVLTGHLPCNGSEVFNY